MDSVQFALPRPGKVTKALLALLAMGGIGGGILWHWVASGPAMLDWLIVSPGDVLLRPWTLLTAAFVPARTGSYGFLFTMLFAYFLASDLERRWGGFRFARFVALTTAASFLFGLLIDKVLPGGAGELPPPPEGALVSYSYAQAIAPVHGLMWLHPAEMYGSFGMMTALAAAWARENPNLTVRLFFFLPITGRAFLWITLGFCVIGLIYPSTISEGAASPFGGFFAAVLLSGSPSPLRALYLRVKLFVLRRRSGHVRIDAEGKTVARSKPRSASAPPLRVVYGGLDEDLKKRPPPKDKRYLN